MIKYGFKIKTRGGMIVDNLMVAARDRTEAERKLSQIYHHCVILVCQEQRQSAASDEGADLESVFALIDQQAGK